MGCAKMRSLQPVELTGDPLHDRGIFIHHRVQNNVEEVIRSAAGGFAMTLDVVLRGGDALQRRGRMSDEDVVGDDRAQLRAVAMKQTRRGGEPLPPRRYDLTHRELAQTGGQRVDDHKEIVREFLDLGKVRSAVRLAAHPRDVFQRQRVDLLEALEDGCFLLHCRFDQ